MPYADALLKAISREFDDLCGSTCRPSILAGQVLEGQLLIALDPVGSDPAFWEPLGYNLLFRWCLDMSLDEKGPDHSNFSRLLETGVAQRCF